MTWRLLDPGDISLLARSLNPEQLGLVRRDLSVLAGGPPCQPFSKAAQWSAAARVGLNDARSNCLQDFLLLIEVFLPRIVLMENVAGFVHGSVSALSDIQRTLELINRRNRTRYQLHYRIVNAADFGVPQHRRRAIIVVSRDGEAPIWPLPTHLDAPLRVWDAIGNIQVEDPPKAIGKWADLLPSIPEGENYLWHTTHGGGKPLFGYRTRYWSFLLKLARDRPSWTIPAQPGPSTGPFHWDNRPLAVPELLRLQSFEDSWKVEGDYREQVRQIGNATPPRLAEIIGRSIAAQFFGVSFSGSRLLHQVTRSEKMPEPREPGTVSAKYLKLVGVHPDHPGPGRGPKPRTARPSV